MEHEQPHDRRSGTVAAVLSFIFPGLGQGYLRQPAMGVLFALPVVVVALIALLPLSEGLTRAALMLLDSTIALVALVAIVQIGIWRALSVVHAWYTGRRVPSGWAVLPVLLLGIALMHGAAGYYAWSFMKAGDRIFAPDVVLEQNPWPGTGEAPAVADPEAGVNLAVPIDSDEPPEDNPAHEPEPEILPGEPPAIDQTVLDGIEDSLLNILIVGIDWTEGRSHALTDTMIVVSVNADTGDVYMLSFPRDIADFPLYDGGTYTGRLNSFANYAQRNPDRFPDGGMRSLSRQIGFLLGVPIDHYAAVNLPGFRTVIDAVGGVTVRNTAPINDRKNDLFLSEGQHHLDADTALKYVRSRFGPGNNDFVRARRQQQVLAALRTELLRAERVTDLPGRIDAISRVLNTNFPPSQVGQLLNLADVVSSEPTGSWVLSSPKWAVHPPLSETGGRWVIRLDIDRVAELSRELFGERSIYNH
jgi:LCP family protein required for cell wall assembly